MNEVVTQRIRGLNDGIGDVASLVVMLESQNLDVAEVLDACIEAAIAWLKRLKSDIAEFRQRAQQQKSALR